MAACSSSPPCCGAGESMGGSPTATTGRAPRWWLSASPSSSSRPAGSGSGTIGITMMRGLNVLQSRHLLDRVWDTVAMTSGQRRRLVLLRHAEASGAGVSDHDRPLARRGRRDAPAVGRWLRDAHCVPDQVLCSTARRARETWQLAATALGATVPVIFDHDIYDASPAGLIGIIRGVPSAAGTIVVVGHDPAVRVLALVLAGTVTDAGRGSAGSAPAPDILNRMRAEFPTAAIAVLEVSRPWSKLGPGRARLTGFVTPAEMGTRGTGVRIS
jgi:phosphohistidine phosphatase